MSVVLRWGCRIRGRIDEHQGNYTGADGGAAPGTPDGHRQLAPEPASGEPEPGHDQDVHRRGRALRALPGRAGHARGARGDPTRAHRGLPGLAPGRRIAARDGVDRLPLPAGVLEVGGVRGRGPGVADGPDDPADHPGGTAADPAAGPDQGDPRRLRGDGLRGAPRQPSSACCSTRACAGARSRASAAPTSISRRASRSCWARAADRGPARSGRRPHRRSIATCGRGRRIRRRAARSCGSAPVAPSRTAGSCRSSGAGAQRPESPGSTPNQFRHTYAHMWLADGGTEGDLMRLAGWKSRQRIAHPPRPPRPRIG